MPDLKPLIEGIRNTISIPDLRKRVFFVLALLGVYRIGSFIPTPGVDTLALQVFFEQQRGTIFGFLDIFSGGNLSRLSIFALGIMPYITASIILQLLTVVWPYLERLSKEGELGRKKITQFTRYLAVSLALFQSFATSLALEQTISDPPIIPYPGWGFRVMCMLTLTTGTAFIMWIGEQISERGIGNGISLIIEFEGPVGDFLGEGASPFHQVVENRPVIGQPLFPDEGFKHQVAFRVKLPDLIVGQTAPVRAQRADGGVGHGRWERGAIQDFVEGSVVDMGEVGDQAQSIAFLQDLLSERGEAAGIFALVLAVTRRAGAKGAFGALQVGRVLSAFAVGNAHTADTEAGVEPESVDLPFQPESGPFDGHQDADFSGFFGTFDVI